MHHCVTSIIYASCQAWVEQCNHFVLPQESKAPTMHLTTPYFNTNMPIGASMFTPYSTEHGHWGWKWQLSETREPLCPRHKIAHYIISDYADLKLTKHKTNNKRAIFHCCWDQNTHTKKTKNSIITVLLLASSSSKANSLVQRHPDDSFIMLPRFSKLGFSDLCFCLLLWPNKLLTFFHLL